MLAAPVFFPPVSLIVPAYNEGVVITRTIQELARLDYPILELIVIDDGSSDNTFELAQEASRSLNNVRVIKQKNGGKARALNNGISIASHEIVFCMDADSHVEAKAIRQGVRHLMDPAVAAVAGSVMVLNQNSIVGRFQALEYLTGLNFYKAAQSYFGLVTIIPGPSGLFRKGLINKLGGYATDTFAEDCDLTLRLLIDGHRVVFEPDMEVSTEVPGGFRNLVKQRYRWNRGILQAIKKHLPKLLTFIKDPVSAMVIGYMFFEAVILPVVNIVIGVCSIFYILYAMDFTVASMWLVQLTLMDLAVVMMTLWDTRWSMRLLFYALFNRFTYAFFQDLIKVFSLLEEVVGIRMTWGKLDRVGVVKS